MPFSEIQSKYTPVLRVAEVRGECCYVLRECQLRLAEFTTKLRTMPMT